jgi:PAS domain-containing protein
MWLENKVRWILDDAGNIAGIHGVSRDITDRKKAEEALKERDDQFKKLALHIPGMIYQFMRKPDGSYSIPFTTEAIHNTFGCSPEEVREDLTLILKRVLPADREKFIASIESSAEELTPWRCEYRVRLPGRPVKWMLGQSTPEKLPDGSIVWYGFNTDITERRRSDEELKKSLAQVRNALSATVHAMAATVEARDPYTAGHQRRVSDLARSLAKEMKLSKEQIEGIRTAATIHDLGKIPVPAEILSKPSKLTDIEFDLVKAHCQAGHDILKGIDFPWPIARMVLEHHERLDGSGYPKGLRGDELLMESKILAVADVVEAMASHRPYRPAWGIDTALEEIVRNEGVLFDPEAVNACVRLFHEKGYTLQG